MKLNIQSMHTPGLLLATNLVQLANSIAHARSLVTAAYSHAREIATAEANHEAADFCGDPYAHNCGRPHCRPSDSYTGPQPPLVRRFFEVDAIAEAAPPAAGVPDVVALLQGCEPRLTDKIHYCSDDADDYRTYKLDLYIPTPARDPEPFEVALARWLGAAPTPPASEQQRAVVMEELLTRVADWCDQQPKHDWYGRTAGDMVRAFMARQPTPAQENDR
ncbi:hypothetical protein [Metapseudomonas otitidis]|uniref:hypothetical protein n=1 Tax=Metapseudomonas otitidis TaxID=319939 RepID=UPI00244B593B|nr:hypothetical protein [Pseudomonas otitidis]MDH0334499.1 hypothetical protein [Pseudomonas otitidis]